MPVRLAFPGPFFILAYLVSLHRIDTRHFRAWSSVKYPEERVLGYISSIHFFRNNLVGAKGRTKRGTTQGDTMEVRFDAEHAPTKFADEFFLRDKGITQELLLVDGGTGTVVLRLAIDRGPLVDNFWRSSANFYKQTLMWMRPKEITVSEPLESTPDLTGSTSWACNIVRASRNGTEGILEAYHVSPRDVHIAGVGGSSGPVLAVFVGRVQMPLPVLVGIFAEVERRLAAIQGEMG